MGEEILTTGAGAEKRAVDQLVAWSARGNPAQVALLECSVFEVFFGGARGGDKLMECSASGLAMLISPPSMQSA